MFCPRCGEKNPGYAICCLKCGLSLTEVQRILEKQAETDPVIARFAEAVGPETSAVAPDIPTVTIPPTAETEEEVQPEHLTAVQLKDRGNEYYKQGKFLDAIDCYEKSIAIDQFFKDAWYNKSLALKKIEREDQAKVCWGIYKRLEALEKTDK